MIREAYLKESVGTLHSGGIGLMVVFAPTALVLVYAMVLASQGDPFAAVLVNQSLWVSTVMILVFTLVTVVQVNREARLLRSSGSKR